jgi:hypothetical protein
MMVEGRRSKYKILPQLPAPKKKSKHDFDSCPGLMRKNGLPERNRKGIGKPFQNPPHITRSGQDGIDP